MPRPALRVTACAAALAVTGAGCGSTKVKTVVSTTTTTTTVSATTSATGATVATQTTSTTSTTSSGPENASEPALSGVYKVSGADVGDPALPSNPHDGVTNADTQWQGLTGSCSGAACTVQLRRTLSDNTIETLPVTADRPAGVYTGRIPGGDGEAGCNPGKAPINLSIIIRLGGLQDIGGRQIATRLAGHIFATYTCPGQTPSKVVDTYTGARSA